MLEYNDISFNVREAALEDRAAWNYFVDNEDGSFFHYYDWKFFYEINGNKFIPLIIENASSQTIGIFPIVKQKSLVYSFLYSLPEGASGGFLIKKDLSSTDKDKAITAVIKYVGRHYSKDCFYFKFKENLIPSGAVNNEATSVLVDNGFHLKYNNKTHLPCTHILELKQPFEDSIWKGLWSHDLRKVLNKAEKSGAIVIEDRELHYADDFISMYSANLQRHGGTPVIRDEIMTGVNIFKDKLKLFVAIFEEKPIVALLCYYTPSTCYLAKIGSHTKNTDHVNKLCYKYAIKDACDRGYRYVEFGVTTTSSLSYFKDRFGTDKVPLRIWEKQYSFKMSFIEKNLALILHAWFSIRNKWKNIHTMVSSQNKLTYILSHLIRLPS